MEEVKNTNKTFTVEDFGIQKLDKRNELNASMTISEKPADAYEQTIKNLGGER